MYYAIYSYVAAAATNADARKPLNDILLATVKQAASQVVLTVVSNAMRRIITESRVNVKHAHVVEITSSSGNLPSTPHCTIQMTILAALLAASDVIITSRTD